MIEHFTLSEISLLTFNGIPPQLVGGLNEQQQQEVIRYGDKDRSELYPHQQSKFPDPLRPFAKTVAAIASSFTSWGAVISTRDESQISFHSKLLEVGGTTFGGDDVFLHNDLERARENLNQFSMLDLRLICVSNSGADFLDFTARPDMANLLEQHRKPSQRRLYENTLLALAHNEGRVIRLPEWSILVFDSGTPHLPRGMLKAGRRQFMDAWITLLLPNNWRERVSRGDVPKFKPLTLAQ